MPGGPGSRSILHPCQGPRWARQGKASKSSQRRIGRGSVWATAEPWRRWTWCSAPWKQFTDICQRLSEEAFKRWVLSVLWYLSVTCPLRNWRRRGAASGMLSLHPWLGPTMRWLAGWSGDTDNVGCLSSPTPRQQNMWAFKTSRNYMPSKQVEFLHATTPLSFT